MTNGIIGIVNKTVGKLTTNISNQGVPGFTPTTTVLGARNIAGVAVAPKMSTNLDYTMPKEVHEGCAYDLSATDTNSFFVCKPEGGLTYLNQSLQLEIKNDKLVPKTNPNHILQVASLQNINANTSEFQKSDLVDCDISNYKASDPTQTSSLYTATTILNKKNPKLAGLYKQINMSNRSKLNTSANDDELLVSENGAVALAKNDYFEFELENKNIKKHVVYSGNASSYKPSENLKVLGARDYTQTFNTDIANGDTISMTIGGKDYQFTFKQNGPQAQNKEFNSLKTLRDAIVKTAANDIFVKSKDNIIYLAPKDPNLGMTFNDSTGGGIVQKLGFIDLADPARPDPNVETVYYRTKAQFKDAVAGVRGIDFSEDGKHFSFGGINDSAKIAGDAKGEMSASAVFYKRYNNIAGGQDNAGHKRELVVYKPNHGLKDGELIQLTNDATVRESTNAAVVGAAGSSNLFTQAGGLNVAALAQGMKYSVANVTEDSFTIALPVDIVAGNISDASMGGAMNVGDLRNILRNNTELKFRRAIGEYHEEINLGGVQVSQSAHHVDANHLQINNATPPNLTAGDIVYIKGFGQNPVQNVNAVTQDGYYVVEFVDNARLYFTITGANLCNNAAAGPANLAAAAKMRIVGKQVANSAHNANTAAAYKISNAVVGEVLEAGKLKLNVPFASQRYQVGDMMDLKGFADAVNNVDPNKLYKITKVNQHDIEIAVAGLPRVTAAANPAAGADVFAYNADGGHAASSRLGRDARLNQFALDMRLFGLDPSRVQSANAYDASVRNNFGDNAEKYSLAKIHDLNPKDTSMPEYVRQLKKSLQVKENITMYDSQGEEIKTQILFATTEKTGGGTVLYEVRVQKGANGQFPVNLEEGDEYGVVGYGRLTFDEQGLLLNHEIDKETTITFKSGEEIKPNIIFDEEKDAQDGDIDPNKVDFAKIKLQNADTSITAKANGNKPANRSGVEIKDGQIYVLYEDGASKPVYSIVIGRAQNPEHLKSLTNGGYGQSIDSGEISFYNANHGSFKDIVVSGIYTTLSSENTFSNLHDISNSQNLAFAYAKVSKERNDHEKQMIQTA